MLSNSERRVRTVLGDVPLADGVHIQCHEHIWLRKGASFAVDPALCMDGFAKSLQELLCYKAAGGGMLVDAQPGGFGRDAGMLKALAEQSGVPVLTVTGFHRPIFMEPDCPQAAMDEDALAALYAGEVTDGIAGTEIRASIVKAAFEPETLTDPLRLRLLRGAALAAAQTGAVLMLHTEKNTDVPALLRLLSALGVRYERLLLCHLDRTCPDFALHRSLVRMGCTLCYDSIHRHKYVSDAQELALIGSMASVGCDDRIVLSLDTTARRLRAYGSPDMGLDYILTDFIPMLRRAGISQTGIQNMCCRNAAALLAR